MRSRQPRRLIAAVGVAPPSSLPAIERLADEVVCLATPREFFAVGQFFRDFRQVEDADVIEILRQSGGPVAAGTRTGASETRTPQPSPTLGPAPKPALR